MQITNVRDYFLLSCVVSFVYRRILDKVRDSQREIHWAFLLVTPFV